MEVREIHSRNERDTENWARLANLRSTLPYFLFVGYKTICTEMETKGFLFRASISEIFILELHTLHVSEG